MADVDHIHLALRGRDLNPDEVDSVLGIRASSKRYVGQVPYSPTTGEHGRPQEHGVWLLSTSDYIHTTDLRDHVNWLLTHVDSMAVRQLRGLEDASLLLCITLRHERAEEFIERRLLRFAVDLGACMHLVVEYWPDENAGGDPEKAEPA